MAVVGSGNYNAYGTMSPTPTPSPKVEVPASGQPQYTLVIPQGTLVDSINQKLTNVKLSVVGPQNTPSTYGISLLEGLSSSQLQKLGNILKKMGYDVKGNIGSIKDLFILRPELEALLNSVVSSNGVASDLIDKLNSVYIPLGDTTEQLPTRTIGQQDPKVLEGIVDDIYQKTLKRNATAQEKASHLTAAQEKIQQGTLTTTKKVKNPKTGQMENVTTVEPSFSQAGFQEDIQSQLKKLNPDDFDRAKRLDFMSWLTSSTIGGA